MHVEGSENHVMRLLVRIMQYFSQTYIFDAVVHISHVI